jgi:hypothetical protein
VKERTPELETLSDDHYHCLAHARRLRKADVEVHLAEKTAGDRLDF